MARPRKDNQNPQHSEHTYCNFYIYGANFEYLLSIQGAYEKKGKVMGLARVIDVIVTNSRQSNEQIPYDEIIESGNSGAIEYKAEGDNKDYLIDLKIAFKKSKISPKKSTKKNKKPSTNVGLRHIINSIVSHTRKGK